MLWQSDSTFPVISDPTLSPRLGTPHVHHDVSRSSGTRASTSKRQRRDGPVGGGRPLSGSWRALFRAEESVCAERGSQNLRRQVPLHSSSSTSSTRDRQTHDRHSTDGFEALSYSYCHTPFLIAQEVLLADGATIVMVVGYPPFDG